MREDCRHFASRLYDDGEAARFCVLDLAPEAPWRCPDNCPQYQRTVIDGSFVQGSLVRERVEDEPDEKPEDIQDLFDDAEMILDAAEPDVLADLDKTRKPGRKWWQRGKRKPSRRRRRLALEQSVRQPRCTVRVRSDYASEPRTRLVRPADGVDEHGRHVLGTR